MRRVGEQAFSPVGGATRMLACSIIPKATAARTMPKASEAISALEVFKYRRTITREEPGGN